MMKKRILGLTLASLLVFSLAACSKDKPQDTTPTGSPSGPTAPVQTTPPATLPDTAGALGNYGTEMKDFELVKDSAGKPAILIAYTFYNAASEPVSAGLALSAVAYQNGVQLGPAEISDTGVYNITDLETAVEPGGSIDVKAAFSLLSETAPVEFEVTELMALSDEKQTKTYEIASGGATELNKAPDGEPTQTLDEDYVVSLVSHKIAVDYEGNNAVIVEFGFTNNSEEAVSFAEAMAYSAFQDGAALERTVMAEDSGADVLSEFRSIKPGAGISVTVAYRLIDETTPVDLEIERTFSFSEDKLTAELNIAE